MSRLRFISRGTDANFANRTDFSNYLTVISEIRIEKFEYHKEQ